MSKSFEPDDLPEAGPTVAAQWAPDPWNPDELRYWDGADWSGYTAPAASVTDRPRVAPRHLRAMGALAILGSAVLASEVVLGLAVLDTADLLVWAVLAILAVLATWVFVLGAVGRSGSGHGVMVAALLAAWMGALSPILAGLAIGVAVGL